MLLALGTAVAAGAGRGTVRTQVLGRPLLHAEVALSLAGSETLLGGRLQGERIGLVVLQPGGSIDTRFGTKGLVVLPSSLDSYISYSDVADPIAVDQAGRILIAEPGAGTVRRLLPDGSLDRSFGSGGLARVGFGSELVNVTSVAVQPDGEILAGGGARSECHALCSEAPALARLTEDGVPDPSFGDGGHEILTGQYHGEDAEVMGLAVGPDGEIFSVSGGGSSNPTIQRLAPDGEIDWSFGRRGSLIVGQAGLPHHDLITLPGIIVAPDGKLVVAGDIEVGPDVEAHGGADAMVAFRYLADGKPDTSFGRNGHVVLRTHVEAFASAAAVRPDGGVVLAGVGRGSRKRYLLVAALRPDGTPDPAVGKDGVAEVASGASLSALVLQRKMALAVGYKESPTKIDPHKDLARTVLVRVPLSK
jgi:uncharacterized delta-60 repeat protein